MVIICTDGLSNKGLGRLDLDMETDSVKFYNDISTTAKDNGVVLSVISIKGEGCKVDILGNLVE